MIDIDIFRDERFVNRITGDTMAGALKVAAAHAKDLMRYYDGDTTLFLRDGLGGLRAEVRKRGDKITVRKT